MKRLKEDILKEIEFRVLSDFYKKGERLPAERDLASEFKVSRPVVHESLLTLESRGLVTMRPRHGTVVNDFRVGGTMDLLTSLLCHADSGLNPHVLTSLYRIRVLLESDAAMLAAERITEEEIGQLAKAIHRNSDSPDPAELASRDFLIHHLISRFSGNIVYPLMSNTLKPVYLEFLTTFYAARENNEDIRLLQYELLEAFKNSDGEKAASIMKRLSSFTIG